MKEIYKVLEKDEKYSTISRNTKTNKVEIEVNGARRPFVKSFMVDEIRDLLREHKVPEMKKESAIVSRVVEQYADDHPYTPEEKKKKEVKIADWQAGMDFTENGLIVDSALNDMLFFEHHPDMQGRLYYNEIEQTEMLDGKALNDIQLSILKTDAEKAMGGNRNPTNIKTAALAYCDSHRYNPLRDKLVSLRGIWDGKPRVEDVFIKAFECPDDEYHRYISKVFFYAWINRMLNPGCKFDVLFVFIGDHGIGKSEFPIRLLKVIGGKWAEGVTFSSERDNLEKIADSQLCMMSEMKSMKKSELEAIKEMLGRSVDTFARKYRSNNNFKRSCILVGNVNLEYKHILKDSAEYERRFILFDCRAEGTSKGNYCVRMNDWWWDEQFSNEEMEQIWSEALYMVENEKDFQWRSLPANIITYLKDIQQECKAINTDDIFLQKLEETLNLPFIEEGYDNYDRFVSAIENAKTALRTPKSGKLQWVHKPMLRRYIKDVMKEDRSAEYFDQAMRMLGWRLELTRYDKTLKKAIGTNRYVKEDDMVGKQLELA